MTDVVLVVLTALTAAWIVIAKVTDWEVAYFMAIMHMGVMCMGADSML